MYKLLIKWLLCIFMRFKLPIELCFGAVAGAKNWFFVGVWIAKIGIFICAKRPKIGGILE